MGISYSKKEDTKELLYIVIMNNLNIINLIKTETKNKNSYYTLENPNFFNLIKESDIEITYIDKDIGVNDKIIFKKNFCNDSVKISRNKIFNKEYIDHSIEMDNYTFLIRFNKNYKGLESIVILK